MDSSVPPPEQSPLALTDITSKKKVFHLANNILILSFSIIFIVYHVVAGIIWFAYSLFGYGLSDILMFFLNFFTLSIGITGIVPLLRENMHISYRYTLLKFNVGSAMVGMPFLSFTYLFISLTEYSYSVTNMYSLNSASISDGLNYAHCTFALIWALVCFALSLSTSISGFLYFQYFDEFRLEKSKQELIQAQQNIVANSTSVIVQQ